MVSQAPYASSLCVSTKPTAVIVPPEDCFQSLCSTKGAKESSQYEAVAAEVQRVVEKEEDELQHAWVRCGVRCRADAEPKQQVNFTLERLPTLTSHSVYGTFSLLSYYCSAFPGLHRVRYTPIRPCSALAVPRTEDAHRHPVGAELDYPVAEVSLVQIHSICWSGPRPSSTLDENDPRVSRCHVHS